ncbi:MAG: MarR family transcriptional regulator [Chloroflexi bacterium]|nr:MarR family transcriptional regulator [Chloroflexota bacterium]
MKTTIIATEAYDLWLLLQRTTYDIRKLREFEIKKEIKTTLAHAAVLLAISSVDHNLTNADLSRIMQRKPHTIHELIGRMEKEGLVKRIPDSNNQKKTVIVITDKGKDIHDKTKDTTLLVKIMTSLPPKKREQLRSDLWMLREKAITELAINHENNYV